MFPSQISQAEILGVNEALANLTERGAIDPVVKVTVALSESGFAVLQDAVVFGEIKDESITGTFILFSTTCDVEMFGRQAQRSIWWRSVFSGLVRYRFFRCHSSVAITISVISVLLGEKETRQRERPEHY